MKNTIGVLLFLAGVLVINVTAKQTSTAAYEEYQELLTQPSSPAAEIATYQKRINEFGSSANLLRWWNTTKQELARGGHRFASLIHKVQELVTERRNQLSSF